MSDNRLIVEYIQGADAALDAATVALGRAIQQRGKVYPYMYLSAIAPLLDLVEIRSKRALEALDRGLLIGEDDRAVVLASWIHHHVREAIEVLDKGIAKSISLPLCLSMLTDRFAEIDPNFEVLMNEVDRVEVFVLPARLLP